MHKKIGLFHREQRVDFGHSNGISGPAPAQFGRKGCFFMQQTRSLSDLHPGERGVVGSLQTTGAMRRRFLDIGLVEDTAVECLGRSPGGDPSAYLIRGAVIAIRSADGDGVLLREG